MKDLQKKAFKIAKETGKDPIDCFIEIANSKVVDEYSDEVYEELKEAGYSFATIDNNLNLLAIREEKRRLPILKNCRFVFTEANIVINDVKTFFTEVAKKHFPELYENLKKIEEENKKREKVLKSWMKANNIVFETDSEDEVEKLMEKYSSEVENYNIETKEGTFFHSLSLRTAIDDYSLFGFITKTPKEKYDLIEYLDVKNMIMREDFTRERVCWECGNAFRFTDIEVDNKDESAVEQIKRKIQMWEERYCGC